MLTTTETPEAAALLGRIVSNPAILDGKPIIRGRRLAVDHMLGFMANGDTVPDILKNFPWLEPDDIRACLMFAQRAVEVVVDRKR